MATPAQVRKTVSQIERLDWELAEEIKKARNNPAFIEEARKIAPLVSDEQEGMFKDLDTSLALETIVLRVGRPVLTISDNLPRLEFTDIESLFWKEKLQNAHNHLLNIIPSVGRIEVKHHPFYEWIGTGWMVAADVLVTNRHVAQEFGSRNGANFVFRQLLDTPVTAAVDFLKEEGSLNERSFRLIEILHIEDDRGPDLALLKVAPSGNIALPPALPLFTGAAAASTDVAVIGYPAKDSRIPDIALMEQLFGNVYNSKRLAPGKITAVANGRLFHDCTTLGGCSGGIVLDLQRGEAVGLHFAGRFLESNYAVPASIVAARLAGLQRVRPHNLPREDNRRTSPQRQDEQSATPAVPTQSTQTIAFNLPIQITVTVGQPALSNGLSKPGNIPAIDDDAEFYTEGRVEDYEDRKGYVKEFLGSDFIVPLPEVADRKRRSDVRFYDRNGEQDAELRYEHFSVVMSKKRRLCYFSAVNIDGAKSRKATRVGWRRDPRIPQDAQILKECYGQPPKFSRGHMTRREDPIWGRETAALRGNADSMCVTNTIPQMQTFNSPIWLGLEDYALDHAREDDMKISVFTGPVLSKNDPVIFGVRIPITSWKIIAFIHDETGELSATAYKMSQREHLPEEEFIFGAYEAAQTSVAAIEKLTGLSFGELSAFDPLNEQEELPAIPLLDFKQIKF
jgi:endonuclease G